MKKQTFRNGDVVRFNANNIPYRLIENGGCPDAEAHENKIATIEHLETHIELGDKNMEYYTIQFEDGMIWWGISGYHLTPVSTFQQEKKKMFISLIVFIFVILFALTGESLIEKFLEYINNLNP
jgi:hypothetical protein